MGVSGSGKTTVGVRLAADLGWAFVEGDEFHPARNVEKMRAGIPLTDADRWPWLHSLRKHIQFLIAREQSAVIASSALKHAYREVLSDGLPEVEFVLLQGSFGLIHARLQARRGHYMPAALLKSQFAALETPDDALVVRVDRPPGEIVNEIKDALGLRPDPKGAS